jgi:phosphatidylethanolamine-binding protein (PEBP) family uncharacterized protein
MLRRLTAAVFVNLLTLLPTSGDAKGASSMTLSLTSSAFVEGGEIPTRYTCEGQGVSPPLAWSELPSGTRSLALIVDDPDAPDPTEVGARRPARAVGISPPVRHPSVSQPPVRRHCWERRVLLA